MFEAGGISVLGGIHSYQLQNQPDGSLLLSDIEAAIWPDDPHDPITRFICLENTHNRCGGQSKHRNIHDNFGSCTSAEFKSAFGWDGIFNAAPALGVPVPGINPVRVDSVTFCLSKGLCATGGFGTLRGYPDLLKKAKRARKILGGGMRQAGILAAAGIIAIQKMANRLGEDHDRAKDLAEGLSENSGDLLDPGTPATNMVFFSCSEFDFLHRKSKRS